MKNRDVNLIGNFNDRKCEGSIKIVNVIKKGLYSKIDLKVNDTNYLNYKLINIHSSGFLDSIKFKKIKAYKIYSLHSNINPIYFNSIRDFIDGFKYFYSKEVDYISTRKRLVKFVIQIVAQFIPLFVKRYFLKKMDLIIVSNNWIKKKINLKNVVIIRHGININKYKNLNLKSNSKKISVNYFGHPTADKGLIEVIKAFSKLDNSKYKKVISPSILTKKIKKKILNIDNSIELNDYISDIKVAYNKSDIVVLPYRHSSGSIATPLVLLEAMACERAVITTNLPHLKEIGGDSIFYVNLNDIDDIIEKIDYLAKNLNLRKKLGKRARERVLKYYNEENMLKEYEKLYVKFIKK